MAVKDIYTSLRLFLLGIAAVSCQRRWFSPYGNNTILVLGSGYGGYYPTTCNTYRYFSVLFYYPCNDLTISVLPSTGNPHLFVSRANLDFDPYPTDKKMAWSATKADGYSVTISHWDPESAPGWYYVGVYNDCTEKNETSWYQIKATKDDLSTAAAYADFYTKTASLVDLYQNPKAAINQYLSPNNYVYYRFCIPQCGNVKISIDNCDDQTKCPSAYATPHLLVSRTEQQPTIDSYR
jgi:hypothetical protein